MLARATDADWATLAGDGSHAEALRAATGGHLLLVHRALRELARWDPTSEDEPLDWDGAVGPALAALCRRRLESLPGGGSGSSSSSSTGLVPRALRRQLVTLRRRLLQQLAAQVQGQGQSAGAPEYAGAALPPLNRMASAGVSSIGFCPGGDSFD